MSISKFDPWPPWPITASALTKLGTGGSGKIHSKEAHPVILPVTRVALPVTLRHRLSFRASSTIPGWPLPGCSIPLLLLAFTLWGTPVLQLFLPPRLLPCRGQGWETGGLKQTLTQEWKWLNPSAPEDSYGHFRHNHKQGCDNVRVTIAITGQVCHIELWFFIVANFPNGRYVIPTRQTNETKAH